MFQSNFSFRRKARRYKLDFTYRIGQQKEWCKRERYIFKAFGLSDWKEGISTGCNEESYGQIMSEYLFEFSISEFTMSLCTVKENHLNLIF